jgi:RHS repeat-associated protein
MARPHRGLAALAALAVLFFPRAAEASRTQWSPPLSPPSVALTPSSVAVDPNGNTTSKTQAGVETRFLFDIRNQLSEVRQGPAILGRYGYDYDGRRIFKIGADGIRRYTYDQRSVITEADQAGATVSKYDYGLDQLVRLNHRNEGKSFFHLDGLGSTVNLTTDAGAARESIFYNAWGQERDRIGASANRFTFTGHEIDRETGLFYAKARFYDPEIGRFLSQDSFLGDVNEPPSLHRYFYANDNPLLFVDPTGNFSWKDLTTSSWLARAGRALQDLDVGSSLGVNFGVQFLGQAAQLPEQVGTGLLNLVTPGGLDVVAGEAPAAPPASASRFFQIEALKEAANPENSYLLRGTLAATAVLSQPMVVIEEALINPIREVSQQSGRVGIHISRAIDADNGVDRTVHLLEATKEGAAAFGTLGSLAAGAQGLVKGRPGPNAAPRRPGGPPADPYDVEGWQRYYAENPGVPRYGPGAAHIDDPAFNAAKGGSRLVEESPLVARGPNAELRPGFVHDDYVRWVRGRGATQVTFDTPWSSSRGLGTRRFDDFDPRTGTAYEGNTTPWSQMTQEKLSKKLEQVGSDFTLMKVDPRVRKVIWFGTEELPTTGLGGQLREALKKAGIPYWVVKP